MLDLDARRLARLEEALVARKNARFADYGIDDDPDVFVDALIDLMGQMYPAFTIDELLLRPREAIKFCDVVRHRHGAYDLPDDVILRPMLNRRKHPG
jgi:hypothetical protein